MHMLHLLSLNVVLIIWMNMWAADPRSQELVFCDSWSEMWISDVMIPWSLALVLVLLLNLKADEGLPDIQDVYSPRQSTAAVHPYFVFACGLQQRHISSSWRKMIMFVCQCCIKCLNWTHADSSFSCLSLFLPLINQYPLFSANPSPLSLFLPFSLSLRDV